MLPDVSRQRCESDLEPRPPGQSTSCSGTSVARVLREMSTNTVQNCTDQRIFLTGATPFSDYIRFFDFRGSRISSWLYRPLIWLAKLRGHRPPKAKTTTLPPVVQNRVITGGNDRSDYPGILGG